MRIASRSSRLTPYVRSLGDDLTRDAVALFTEQMQGHMERWEYSPSLYQGDPAAGGDYWADLVKHPGHYYLTQGDTNAIQWAIQQPDMMKVLSDVQHVMELGPGSHEAILKKTVPFLKACPSLEGYTAVDATIEQAADAAKTVRDELSISTDTVGQNYMNTPLAPQADGKAAIVMWGSSLGNIDGFANEDPLPKLVQTLDRFKAGLKSGDLMILCFDTEQDERKVLNAYSEPSLRAQILSVVHLLKRDGQVTGKFDPRIWQHESMWYPKVGQCAHMIYPIYEQELTIAGLTIHIPAWRRFISNNSYKFLPETVVKAVKHLRLNTVACLQNGPIAILIAERK